MLEECGNGVIQTYERRYLSVSGGTAQSCGIMVDNYINVPTTKRKKQQIDAEIRQINRNTITQNMMPVRTEAMMRTTSTKENLSVLRDTASMRKST